MFETIGFSLIGLAVLLGSIRRSGMSDKVKIEKILEYTRIMVAGLNGEVKKCKYIRDEPVTNDDGGKIGTKYVFRLPLGMPYKKLEALNDNAGVFSDGLGKKVEVDWDGGMMHVFVYEDDIPKKWLFKKMYRHLREGSWSIPIGETYKGLVWHDFDKIPHMVVGGTTRYGKTNALKAIITSLILSNPEDVEIYVIDLKNKLEFGRYEKLKQIKQVAGTPEESADMLEGLLGKLNERMVYFHKNGFNNITQTPIKKRTFIIVDEANRLVPQSRGDKTKVKCQTILEDIACTGGGIGFRLMFCTQYPVKTTMPSNIKQNSDAKMCFRLQNGYASEVVLGEGNTQGSYLKDVAGRCMFRQGPNMVEMQIPFISERVMDLHLRKFKEEEERGIEIHRQGNEDNLQFKETESS